MAIEKRRLKTYALGPDRRADRARGTACQRGYGRKWQKARAEFLRKNPLCVACKERGQITAATEVDHIVPHRGDMKLFWDRKNWQSLCKPDHSAKTGRGE